MPPLWNKSDDATHQNHRRGAFNAQLPNRKLLLAFVLLGLCAVSAVAVDEVSGEIFILF